MPLSIEVGEHRVVSREAVREPALVRLRSGDLLLTYHVQADVHFAQRKGLRSSDGGRTWRDEPQRAHREQAIGQSAQGTVLAADIYHGHRRDHARRAPPGLRPGRHEPGSWTRSREVLCWVYNDSR